MRVKVLGCYIKIWQLASYEVSIPYSLAVATERKNQQFQKKERKKEKKAYCEDMCPHTRRYKKPC